MKTLTIILTILTTTQAFAYDFTRAFMFDAINSHLTCDDVKRKMSVNEDSYGGSEREIIFNNGSSIICNRHSDMVTSLKLTRSGADKFFAPTIQDLFDLSESDVIREFGKPDDYDNFIKTHISYYKNRKYPTDFILKDGWMKVIVFEFPMNDN